MSIVRYCQHDKEIIFEFLSGVGFDMKRGKNLYVISQWFYYCVRFFELRYENPLQPEVLSYIKITGINWIVVLKACRTKRSEN